MTSSGVMAVIMRYYRINGLFFKATHVKQVVKAHRARNKI